MPCRALTLYGNHALNILSECHNQNTQDRLYCLILCLHHKSQSKVPCHTTFTSKWYSSKKTACRSDMRFPRYKALKSVMGSGRVGSGREYSDFFLKYERTRSARCARSLVIMLKTYASPPLQPFSSRRVPRPKSRTPTPQSAAPARLVVPDGGRTPGRRIVHPKHSR